MARRARWRAVPLFFFHIHNGLGFVPDEEGRELIDEGEARAEAIKGARSLMSAEVEAGCLDLQGRIEVEDADARPVMTIHFRDALAINYAVAPSEQGDKG